ncbi:MAG TPA: hypothetical protein VM141_10380 [Planctomycetota bacterium]|nr:hypothetical protein [Planctomycetota bacterium]
MDHKCSVVFAAAVLVLAALCGGVVFGEDAKEAAKPDEPPIVLPAPSPVKNENLFGGRIQRTMTLLATSGPLRRFPVKIIFYGQSIVNGRWTKAVEDDLRRRFPEADLTIENRAIGGFGADALIRTAAHDIYPAYPDLVVYLVYGGEQSGALEAFVANLRRYTTSEIMLLTHHVRGGDYSDSASAAYWRYLAQKYDCELVDLHGESRQFMAEHAIRPEQLLGGDKIHPNEEGSRPIAWTVLRHFRLNTLMPGGWYDRVRTYQVRRSYDDSAADDITFAGEPWEIQGSNAIGHSPDNPMRLTFNGNRVDILAGASPARKLGTARILIDGQPPSADPRLYAATRPSPEPKMWFPGVRRIEWQSPPIIEDWTLRITAASDDCKSLEYEVIGSITGHDGNGNNCEKFVSNSGRVVIAPRDFAFADAFYWSKVAPPVGYEVTWKVVPLFSDSYEPSGGDSSRPYRLTAAQNLRNGRHTIEIIPNGDGPVPVQAIEVYRPPLR